MRLYPLVVKLKVNTAFVHSEQSLIGEGLGRWTKLGCLAELRLVGFAGALVSAQLLEPFHLLGNARCLQVRNQDELGPNLPGKRFILLQSDAMPLISIEPISERANLSPP
jgi:hypothetical protein